MEEKNMYDLLKKYVIETLLILLLINFTSNTIQIVCIGLWGLSTILLPLLLFFLSIKNITIKE